MFTRQSIRRAKRIAKIRRRIEHLKKRVGSIDEKMRKLAVEKNQTMRCSNVWNYLVVVETSRNDGLSMDNMLKYMASEISHLDWVDGCHLWVPGDDPLPENNIQTFSDPNSLVEKVKSQESGYSLIYTIWYDQGVFYLGLLH